MSFLISVSVHGFPLVVGWARCHSHLLLRKWKCILPYWSEQEDMDFLIIDMNLHFAEYSLMDYLTLTCPVSIWEMSERLVDEYSKPHLWDRAHITLIIPYFQAGRYNNSCFGVNSNFSWRLLMYGADKAQGYSDTCRLLQEPSPRRTTTWEKKIFAEVWQFRGWEIGGQCSQGLFSLTYLCFYLQVISLRAPFGYKDEDKQVGKWFRSSSTVQ